jgi:biopolymer transport protein ExbD
MNFKTSRGDRVELNLTPLIDVVFILLMFFIVTTTFKRNSELKIELPEASAEAEPREKALELVIDAQGRYYINGQALINTKPATLMSALEDATGGRKDLPMVISGDRRTPYQAVVTAMDASARLGLTHFSIATTQAEDAP